MTTRCGLLLSFQFNEMNGVTVTLQVATRLMELPLFLNEAAPFGSVRDGCAESVLAKMTNRPITLSKNEKVSRLHLVFGSC